MAGCLPCLIIPLLLFIFHRFIQPLILKLWNPWEKKQVESDKNCVDESACNRKEFKDYLNDCKTCQRVTDKKDD